jgi:hypothetical protein
LSVKVKIGGIPVCVEGFDRAVERLQRRKGTPGHRPTRGDCGRNEIQELGKIKSEIFEKEIVTYFQTT